jgi:hypothetical protein
LDYSEFWPDWPEHSDPSDEHLEAKLSQVNKEAELEGVLCEDKECPHHFYTHFHPLRPKTVNQQADELVEGHRGTDYGHPSIDLGRTAKLWSALMDFDFTASDVAQMMRMVKESRLRNSPRHRDSLVDICGYARTQEMVWEKEEQSS